MPEGGTELPLFDRDRFGKRFVLLELDEPAGAAVKRVYRLVLDDVVENLPGVRRCAEGLYMHDFRVAVRRTRTGLRQLKGVHPDEAALRFATEFGWIARATNQARDLEVFEEARPRYREALGGEVFGGLDEFFVHVHENTERERAACAKAAAGQRFSRLLDDWRSFLHDTDNGDAAEALTPIRSVAAKRIRRAYDRVVSHGRAVHPGSAGQEFHRLRLQCKKLRYLLEFFRSLFAADKSDDAVESLRAIQDDLGYINDLRVQAGWTLAFVDPALLRHDGRVADAVANLPAEGPVALRKMLRYIEDERTAVRERFLQDFARFIAPSQGAAFEAFLDSRP